MTTTVTIPTLKTERLVLRAPHVDDFDAFSAFLASDRAQYVGGPYTDLKMHQRTFGNAAGIWMLRGYGSFVACLNDDTPIGYFGPWNPIGWPEPEFGWSLWSGDHEGQGYVTEAMRTIIPWAWGVMNVDTVVSYIDAPNAGSIAVAKRLGATFDADATEALNVPDSLFYAAGKPPVHVYRHHEGALT